VPVVEGSNTLVVTFEPTSGAGSTFNVDLQNFAVYTSFFDVEVDAANSRLVVSDTYLDALIDVDTVSGARTPITVNFDGNGVNFGCTWGFGLDPANNRALVTDLCADALFAVDLATGNRSYVSRDGFAGAGPSITAPADVILDSANNRALVTDWNLDAVVAIDLASGDRVILSDAATGTGPNFLFPRGIVHDAANNRVIVADAQLRAIVAVDLASGDRTVISDSSTGTGQSLSTPMDIDLDSANGRLLVTELSRGFIAVDLATGDRTLIDQPALDYGLNGSRLAGVALDPPTNTAYIADSSLDAVLAVDLPTGDRGPVSDSGSGSSDSLASYWGVQGIAYDHRTRQLLVSDFDFDELWTIDTRTAHRTLLAGPARGAGPVVDYPGKLDVDSDNGVAYYTEKNIKAIMSVDLVSGDRTLVSGAGTGAGTDFGFIVDVALDLSRNRALVGAQVGDRVGALFSVDLATGDRTVISDATTGAGPALTVPDSVVYDELNDRALVMDWNAGILFAIDLATGDRTAISDNAGIGAGTTFSVPFDMALDIRRNRVLITDYGRDTVTAVDLTTGDRTQVISYIDIPDLNLFNPYFITVDVDNDRAFVFDLSLNAIVVVELSSSEYGVMVKQ
jgi:sugar lactone lactonase YvrE